MDCDDDEDDDDDDEEEDDDEDEDEDEDDNAEDEVEDERLRMMMLRKTDPKTRAHTCASLCGRNTCQHFTRATLDRNFQEKCRSPACAQNADTDFARA